MCRFKSCLFRHTGRREKRESKRERVSDLPDLPREDKDKGYSRVDSTRAFSPVLSVVQKGDHHRIHKVSLSH